MSIRKKSSKQQLLISKLDLWFSTDELLEYLGISNEELIQQLGLFTEGIHFKYEHAHDPSNRILWRVDLVDPLLSLPIPPLEREAMLNAINNHITCQE